MHRTGAISDHHKRIVRNPFIRGTAEASCSELLCRGCWCVHMECLEVNHSDSFGVGDCSLHTTPRIQRSAQELLPASTFPAVALFRSLRQQQIKNHASPEGSGPLLSEERAWQRCLLCKGSTGQYNQHRAQVQSKQLLPSKCAVFCAGRRDRAVEASNSQRSPW